MDIYISNKFYDIYKIFSKHNKMIKINYWNFILILKLKFGYETTYHLIIKESREGKIKILQIHRFREKEGTLVYRQRLYRRSQRWIKLEITTIVSYFLKSY